MLCISSFTQISRNVLTVAVTLIPATSLTTVFIGVGLPGGWVNIFNSIFFFFLFCKNTDIRLINYSWVTLIRSITALFGDWLWANRGWTWKKSTKVFHFSLFLFPHQQNPWQWDLLVLHIPQWITIIARFMWSFVLTRRRIKASKTPKNSAS